MFLVSLLRNKLSDNFNRSWWLAKFLLLAYLSIQSLYIRRGFFKGFFWFSVVLSPVAIVLLLVCLMDLCYKVAERIAERYFDHGKRVYGVILIATSVAATAGGIYTVVVSVQQSCSTSMAWIFAGLSLLSFILTITKIYDKSNMMTTSVYFMATSYLLRLSSASQSCGDSPLPLYYQAAYFTALALAATAFISTSDDANEDYVEVGNTPRSYEMAATSDGGGLSSPGTTEIGNTESGTPEEVKARDDSRKLFRKQTVMFHFFMVLVGTLATVLVTGWKYDEGLDFSELLTVKSELAAWIQGTTSIFGQVLIVWTMVAPRLFPDRAFD